MGWTDGFDEVRAVLSDAGIDPAGLGWGDEAPELRWTLRADEGADAWLLGGGDHGRWMTWRSFPRDEVGAKELAGAVWDLRRQEEPARIPRTLAETAQAAALGVDLMDRAAGWATGLDSEDAVDLLPGAEAKVGTPFDHVGDDSGHVLHHFGTAWGRRAMPAEAAALPITGLLLVHNLPSTCRVERVPAAHGHPGGAWRVVLDKPIAAYREAGGLRPFLPKDA